MVILLLSLTSMYLLGYAGYIILSVLRIPAPGLIGTMVIVGFLASKGVPWPEIPSYVRFILQVVVGITVGMRFSKKNTKQIKSFLLPGIIIVIWTIGTGLLIGFILEYYTNMDIGTSLFSAVPGGITEMSVVALSYGLETPVIVLFQFMRILGVCLTVPFCASLYKEETTIEQVNSNDKNSENEEKKNSDGQSKYSDNVLLTILIGVTAGYISLRFKLPAGAMLGSMLVVGFLKSLGFHLKSLPKEASLIAQIGLGGIIGLSFTPAVSKLLLENLVPAVVFSIAIVLNSIILGFVIHKIFGWDMTTSLLACAPAGLSQMSMIALDMNADAVKVGIIHIMRLTTIVLVVPYIISSML